jgi:hypothetical protein
MSDEVTDIVRMDNHDHILSSKELNRSIDRATTDDKFLCVALGLVSGLAFLRN